MMTATVACILSVTMVTVAMVIGFLTDDLTVHDDKGEGSGCKYLGVCKLEGPERKVRDHTHSHPVCSRGNRVQRILSP